MSWRAGQKLLETSGSCPLLACPSVHPHFISGVHSAIGPLASRALGLSGSLWPCPQLSEASLQAAGSCSSRTVQSGNQVLSNHPPVSRVEVLHPNRLLCHYRTSQMSKPESRESHRETGAQRGQKPGLLTRSGPCAGNRCCLLGHSHRGPRMSTLRKASETRT